MRRYLVVANMTLGSGELAHELRQRVEAGSCEFYLVVPATLSTGVRSRDGALMPPSDEDTAELVQRRLDAELKWLRNAGVPVQGEVGDEDPFKAVTSVLDRREFDEVIVSTLPQGTSRWLRMDLVNRVRRKTKLPVAHVVSKKPTLGR